MADIIIIHGTLGSPEGNWFPWMKNALEARAHSVFIPEFPTPEGQSKDGWRAVLRDQAPVFDDNTVLIGHSIGATFLLHILESMTQPVKGSFFISPVMDVIDNPEYGQLNASFIKAEFDWSHMQHKAGLATIMHGDDDPYVPLSHAQALAHHLDVPLDVVKNGGHLNAESGYTQFAELLDKVTKIA